MAVPKRKKSKAKTAMRRAQWKLKMPGLSLCPECGQPKSSHRVCSHCGYYKNKEVIEVV